ncbi:Aspartyl protease family protein [Dichanthelium oligosanthes]|uniref:Aspartyl protease family protein n=1 Tax=Dichanthelium oligosanthes TaxID=888268 RepID=A0A1E5VGX6_9POAL|nr:Aspartyl protease family protein [Dichanthelium oligosanthes]
MASSAIKLTVWLLVSTTCQQVLTAQQQQQHHTISVESLLSSTMCSSAPAEEVTPASRPEGGSTFQIVHRACRSPGNHMTVSDHYNTILQHDHHRVRSIHRRLTAQRTPTSIPARLGVPFHSLEYVVTIGIGTPRRNLTVLFDTGSDLSWVQCTTCGHSCYHQEEPLFNPSSSSSYSNIPCSAVECDIASDPEICSGGVCRYNMSYVDGSSTGGNLAHETVALSPSAPADTGIVFGCSDVFIDFDDFGVAGLLGLGRGPLSIVSQTQRDYNGSLSYCLPPRGSSTTGYLTFGAAAQPQANLAFTPLTNISPQLSSFYVVELAGISVNGAALPILPYAFSGGAVVDSGTVMTQLLPAAYYPLRDEFRRHMASYTMLPEGSMVDNLDTCYDVTGHDVVNVPRVALEFGGGARIDVDASGILLVAGAEGSSVACLAFQPMGPVGISAIIGNMQQRTYNVVFDVAGGRVGFGANGCS